MAFEQQIELDVPWTDYTGRRHEKMIGRPVSMHAMRGISAHANGFQTCRILHILQIILGTIDVPGGFRYKPPFPKADTAAHQARGQAGAGPAQHAHARPALGFRRQPQ